jgi:branched-chain amino acid transport system ATP-binding protein
MLETRNLRVGYGGNPVVEGINICVEDGEIVAVLGRNGSGKTTTLSTIAGLLSPISGDVCLDGVVVTDPLHRRARRGVALIPEERAVIKRLSVWDNMRLGIGKPKDALELFPELVPLRNRNVGLLSGGEQQMVALARCLAAKPRLLLVDELSFGLAPLIVERLGDALKLAAKGGAGVLLVEQHAHIALSLADRGYVLGLGQVQTTGTAEELTHRWGEIESSYLSSGVLEAEAGHLDGAP